MSEGRQLDLDTFDLCRCEANCHVQLEMFIYLIYIAKRLYLVSFFFFFFFINTPVELMMCHFLSIGRRGIGH